MYLEDIDKKLLNLLQREFPLVPEPYYELGLKLGIGEDEVIRRTRQLKTMGLIRQISPVLDSRRLGYQSTLVAMRVEPAQMDKTEQLIGEHPGISHGYERDHFFNIWFTLSVPPEADIEAELHTLSSDTGAESAFALPAVKVFKIGVYFDMNDNGQNAEANLSRSSGVLPKKVKLSERDKLIINELQQDLPPAHAPFAGMAARLGMDVEDFLAGCRSLLQCGVIRRFGAAINHLKAGFTANAMTCWVAPPEMLTAAGQKLASLKVVSHCYERKTHPLWRYNLFAIVHGRAKEECREVVSSVAAETGLKNYVMLFSTREIKKMRVKCLV